MICIPAAGCYSSSGRNEADSPDAGLELDDGLDAAADDAGEPEIDASCLDRDGDGFRDSACGGTDCDDTRGDVYPGAPEVCLDDIDNDCDGLVDGPMLLADDLVVADGLNVGDPPALLWTGEEFVLAWSQRAGIRLARISATGDRVEREVPVAEDAGALGEISLAWTGSDIALAWAAWSEEYHEIYFALVSAAGDRIAAPVRVTYDPWFSAGPDVVWTGSGFAIAWIDTRLTESACTMMGCSYDIYLARLDAHGTKLGDDRRISDRTVSPGGSWAPVWMAWTGTELGVFWSWFARLRPDGSDLAPDLDLGHASDFDMELPVWTGTEYGTLRYYWRDDAMTPEGIYFVRRGSDGAERGRSTVETLEGGSGYSLAWTGDGYGALWDAYEEGGGSVEFRSLTVEGEPRGSTVRVAGGTLLRISHHALVWTGREFGAVWRGRGRIGLSDAVFFNRVGFCD
ncbi:MAG: putative metal-binding motif-containing protein [Myxococcota bacterium]|nr:putative metal-binding motif-containing protein [Myxococcota bacterium]